MSEDFLQYLWEHKLIESSSLIITDEEIGIRIVSFGHKNKDSGPDFFNGQVEINGTLWSGNIEIHINASDWNHHRHQFDKNYNNVILHVVLNNDCSIKTEDDREIPTFTLDKEKIKGYFSTYLNWLKSGQKLPCGNAILGVDSFVLLSWTTRLVVTRLERKSQQFIEELDRTNSDWQEASFRWFGACFGLSINFIPMMMLMRSIPYKLLKREGSTLKKVEAILFGQAAFLNEENGDDYYQNLRKEYLFLQHKHDLKPINKNVWKFFRTRPIAFPTIRIAQLAAWLFQTENVFSSLLSIRSKKDRGKELSLVVSDYWKNHYHFGRIRKKTNGAIGDVFENLLAINGIVLIQFTYGLERQKRQFIEQSLGQLEELKPENNRKLKLWNEILVKFENAFQTQGLLELSDSYCSKKKCLNCTIGLSVLKSKFR